MTVATVAQLGDVLEGEALALLLATGKRDGGGASGGELPRRSTCTCGLLLPVFVRRSEECCEACLKSVGMSMYEANVRRPISVRRAALRCSVETGEGEAHADETTEGLLLSDIDPAGEDWPCGDVRLVGEDDDDEGRSVTRDRVVARDPE